MTKTLPEVNEKELKKVQLNVTKVATNSLALAIKNDKDMSQATELLSQLNLKAGEIKKDKEKLTKPLNAVLKDIRGRYKPMETQLEKGIKHIRSVMGIYQTEKELQAEAEREKIVARVGSGRGKLKVETAVSKMAEVTGADVKVAGESGSVTFKNDYEIISVNKREVPETFLSVDEVGIRKLLNAGAEEVFGVVAKKIKVPINRRK